MGISLSSNKMLDFVRQCGEKMNYLHRATITLFYINELLNERQINEIFTSGHKFRVQSQGNNLFSAPRGWEGNVLLMGDSGFSYWASLKRRGELTGYLQWPEWLIEIKTRIKARTKQHLICLLLHRPGHNFGVFISFFVGKDADCYSAKSDLRIKEKEKEKGQVGQTKLCVPSQIPFQFITYFTVTWMYSGMWGIRISCDLRWFKWNERGNTQGHADSPTDTFQRTRFRIVYGARHKHLDYYGHNNRKTIHALLVKI